MRMLIGKAYAPGGPNHAVRAMVNHRRRCEMAKRRIVPARLRPFLTRAVGRPELHGANL